MIKNITFITAEKEMEYDEQRKQNAIHNINMWLSPLEKELNDSDAKIEMFLDRDNKQHLTISNISNELDSKVMARLSLFLFQYP